MKDGITGSDGRIGLLERLKANAVFTRTSRKTDVATAQLACEMEEFFDKRLAELRAGQQDLALPAVPAVPAARAKTEGVAA